MLKIKIILVGRTKEAWLENAVQDYVKRLSSSTSIEWLVLKTNEQLIKQIDKERSILCLDPLGEKVNSERFCTLLFQQLETGGSRVTFVIGGAEGLPDQIRKKHTLISLSPLTFTHQIARLILIEQIYRAFEIRKGTGYHK
ncbi:MAG: 50S rRNA methyltransferase [Waddliaceae bacterium]|nr:50S rRNA methyltransferase [Waddliaceae bacterium]